MRGRVCGFFRLSTFIDLRKPYFSFPEEVITSWRSQNQNRDGYHLRNDEIIRCPSTFPNTITKNVVESQVCGGIHNKIWHRAKGSPSLMMDSVGCGRKE
jgi:hypothetical protein